MRLILTGLIVLGALCGEASSGDLDPTRQYRFCWSPPTLEGEDGTPLASPVGYDVWLRRDSHPDTMIATVADDTTYMLTTSDDAVYQLRVCAFDSLGRRSAPSEWSDPLVIHEVLTAPSPATADLAAPYPNPCNPSTTLKYTVPADLHVGAPVRLAVLDMRGRRVRELAVDRTPGTHEAIWRGRDQRGQPVGSGTYLARFVCGTVQQVKRVTLVQ